MRYLLLIHSNETTDANMSEAEMGQLMQEYMAFGQEIGESGACLAGERLQPTATAKTVRVRDGKTKTDAGPFAKTDEQLGGYYVIEADDEAAAIAWAAKIPSAKFGSVEVRPIWEMEG